MPPLRGTPPVCGPCLLWPRSPISATTEHLYSISLLKILERRQTVSSDSVEVVQQPAVPASTAVGQRSSMMWFVCVCDGWMMQVGREIIRLVAVDGDRTDRDIRYFIVQGLISSRYSRSMYQGRPLYFHHVSSFFFLSFFFFFLA